MTNPIQYRIHVFVADYEIDYRERNPLADESAVQRVLQGYRRGLSSMSVEDFQELWQFRLRQQSIPALRTQKIK